MGELHKGYKYKQAAAKYKAENGPHYCCFPNCPKKTEPIDLSLHHYDKWSFTIQHITPLSMGGSPHDPDNMAAAHRSCNAKEGNRLAGVVGKVNDIQTDQVMAMSRPRPIQSRVW